MLEPRKIFGGLGNRMFQGAYLLAQQAKGEIPDIYLQDVKYFANIKDQVKEIYNQGIVKSDCVSLHIRRGDYVDNPFYVDLTQTDYYDKAIAEFPNEKFLIFCADRQGRDWKDRLWVKNWAKEKGIDFEVWHSDSEIDDMNAMAGCKAHIMANSSFSWWASFLSGNRTIAPSYGKWYTDKNETRTCLLEEWIKI